MNVPQLYTANPQINWSAGQLMPAPRRSAPNRREMFYPALCPGCSEWRWLRKADARKAKMCGHCQRSIAGQLGYAESMRRYGRSFVLDAIARKQDVCPSSAEWTVRCWLWDWNVNFEKQVRFQGWWVIDLVVGDKLIEVNGYWHKRNRQERDQELAAAWPGPALFLDADLVADYPEQAQCLLRDFIYDSSIS